MPPLIRFENVTYRHRGSAPDTPPALSGISLRIERGEWVTLLGANGSGKTTLARLCNALLLPSGGKVLVDGKDTTETAHIPAIRSRVGMVFQNPEDQMVASVIEEDTAFGPENLGVATPEIRQRITSALEAVGMSALKDRPPHLLSAGQMQRVALAGVLAMQPECVIFDESTAMLDPRGRQDVMEQMRLLHEKGFTVIFITHFMEEAVRAERAVVLHEGTLAFDGSPDKLFADRPLLQRCGLEQPLTQYLITELGNAHPLLKRLPNTFESMLRKIPSYPGKDKLSESVTTRLPGQFLVEVDNLGHTYLPGTPLEQVALHEASLNITVGMAHGIVGATGSGKSTLLQHFNALYRPQRGSLRVGPYDLTSAALDVSALRRFTGLVFQNPEIYFFEHYVGDEIAYGPKMLYGHEGLRERVKAAMNLVGLDFERFKDRITYTLSGGEKRKVALASTLATGPKLLILDEPTAGLDPVSRHNLHTALKKFQADGIEVVLSSHSMGDITQLTRNMTVLAAGRTLRTGDTAELFNDAALIESASLGQPAVVRLAAAFRAKKWPVPASTVTNRQLLTAIRAAGGTRDE